ncbi:hypothetical protein BUALT_Bualt14G0127300 [Buddleja alternifolia]|uniref:DUF7906 domain-containing protein n=1 Tax=Buddleja alternifolia TaxID=168488 RepID=A0AAV6WQJ5_9LAMI|nr:hypothetical protein BUALT_Bualt14G0127300 [Buddleja alternifolia]
MKRSKILYCLLGILLSFISVQSAPQACRSDPGHPTWHHGAFHDVKDSIRSDVRHFRAEVPVQIPLEVNVVLIGFNGDGGYRYTIESQKLEEFLRVGFPAHRPSCLETGQPLDIEHHVVFNAFPAGQPELTLKAAMTPADFGREVPLFEVEATAVEPELQKLYSYLFDIEHEGFPVEEMDRPKPSAIFMVNFDKVRIDPRNKELDLDSLMYGKITHLNDEDMKKQEGDYIYWYCYIGVGASQVWLGSGRFVVIYLSAGPCTTASVQSAHDIFVGQLAAVIATTVEHVVAPELFLSGFGGCEYHNRYNITVKGLNYSIDIEAIEAVEMEQSADVLAAGLLEVCDPNLSSKFFLRQFKTSKGEEKETRKKKHGDLYQTYGTRVVPVFVPSLADVDKHLMMEDESIVWTSNDVVIVLQHLSEK